MCTYQRKQYLLKPTGCMDLHWVANQRKTWTGQLENKFESNLLICFIIQAIALALSDDSIVFLTWLGLGSHSSQLWVRFPCTVFSKGLWITDGLMRYSQLLVRKQPQIEKRMMYFSVIDTGIRNSLSSPFITMQCPLFFNSLSPDIKNSNSVASFKNKLKKHLVT